MDRFIKELCEEKGGGLIGTDTRNFSMVLQYDDLPDDGNVEAECIIGAKTTANLYNEK